MNVYRLGACAIAVAAVAIGVIGHHEAPGVFAKAAALAVPVRSAQAGEHVDRSSASAQHTVAAGDTR